MKPYAVCAPTLTSLTSSALPFAPSTPATLVSLDIPDTLLQDLCTCLFLCPGLSLLDILMAPPSHPHHFLKSLLKYQLVREASLIILLKMTTLFSPVPHSHFISLHSTEHHLTCYLFYFSFVFPQKECRFHAGREWLEYGQHGAHPRGLLRRLNELIHVKHPTPHSV